MVQPYYCHLFQNLYPNDAIKLQARFELVSLQRKWYTISSTGTVRTASGKYNFVTINGKIYIHCYGGHIDIARGQPVQYAGEVQFSGRTNRGKLRWWNNQSGHYQPTKHYATQAGLPLDTFEELLL